MTDASIYTLEFLLAFDGRVHWYDQGYFMKFEIRRVEPTEARPHGLKYSLSLHSADGKRLVGFDNAHRVSARGRAKARRLDADHWHRDESDRGRPYAFKNAETLLIDFFRESERVLRERGLSIEAVENGYRDERSMS